MGGIIAASVVVNRGAIMANLKKLTDGGLRLIARLEGFSEVPYRDAQGFSVGFGHFILPSDTFTYPLSREEGYRLLNDDADIAANFVRGYVTVPLTDNQFSALVSLTYNIGGGAFARSTLLKKLNAGDYAGAAGQFQVWRKSEGKILPALVSRRAEEERIFTT